MHPAIIGGTAIGLLALLASRSKTAVGVAKRYAFAAGDPTDAVLATLDRRMRPLAIAFVERARAAGYPVVLTSGYRSLEEQARLYAQGRTAPGEVVTNAAPGKSAHNFGLAIDFAFGNALGRPTWPEDGPWFGAAQVGKALGLEWGGDWSSFKDRPHLELPEWRASRDLYARTGRSDYAVA